MEEIIRKYFACWLNKDEKPLTDIFAEDIIYSECYGPEYHGIRQIQQWFHDWNQKGNRTEMGCQTNLHQPEHSNYRMVFPVQLLQHPGSI